MQGNAVARHPSGGFEDFQEGRICCDGSAGAAARSTASIWMCSVYPANTHCITWRNWVAHLHIGSTEQQHGGSEAVQPQIMSQPRQCVRRRHRIVQRRVPLLLKCTQHPCLRAHTRTHTILQTILSAALESVRGAESIQKENEILLRAGAALRSASFRAAMHDSPQL